MSAGENNAVTLFADAFEAARAWRDAGQTPAEIARVLDTPLTDGGWDLPVERVAWVLYSPYGLDLSAENVALMFYLPQGLNLPENEVAQALRDGIGLSNDEIRRVTGVTGGR